MPKADPAEGLEPDITEIDDPAAREAEQLKYYGGDALDDDDDLSSLDRGDALDDDPVSEDRGDEIPETKEEEKDEEPAAKDDDAEAEASDDEDDSDTPDAEDESTDDGDEEDVAELDDNVVEPEEDKEERDPGIPRHRFNEVNNRMKEAERRLQELEARDKAIEDAAEDKFDFDKAEAEYVDLLLDGKTEDATAKRSQIRAAEQELFKAETKQETTQDINEQAELRDLNALSVQAEEAYPVFNEDHKDYDPVIANKVVTYMKGYMADGQPVSDAFVSGLADVIEQYNLDTKLQEQSDSNTTPTETKGKPIKKVKEKLEVAEKQGKSPAGAGEGSSARGVSAPSIEDMSDTDLDKLSPEQLARMRGDFVE